MHNRLQKAADQRGQIPSIKHNHHFYFATNNPSTIFKKHLTVQIFKIYKLPITKLSKSKKVEGKSYKSRSVRNFHYISRQYQDEHCCWVCGKCEDYEFLPNETSCMDCGIGNWPTRDRTECFDLAVYFYKIQICKRGKFLNEFCKKSVKNKNDLKLHDSVCFKVIIIKHERNFFYAKFSN